MADQTTSQPAPRAQRRWVRKLAYIAGGMVALLIVTYFVVTSGAFIRAVVLPRIGAALNAEVTASDVALSPFSSLRLRGLKVQPKGDETLLTAQEVLVRYRLMDILGGNIHVDEISLASPTVRVVRRADGSSNLDPLRKAGSSGKSTPPAGGAAKPLQVDVKKIAVNNATLSFLQTGSNGVSATAEVTPFNLLLSDVKNGQAAKLGLDSNFRFTRGGNTAASTLPGALKGSFAIDLGPELALKQLTGDLEVGIAAATGGFAEAANMSARLRCDILPAEVKQFTLNFRRATENLGDLSVQGPFDAQKLEGKLAIQVSGIGKEVLDLVGSSQGIRFGNTRLAANYELELRAGARQFALNGKLTGSQVSVTRSNRVTPVLDFVVDSDAAIDLAKTNVVLRKLTFEVSRAGRPLLKAGVTREMLLDVGKGAEAVAESALELQLNDLNLADWQAFLGTNLVAGTLGGTGVVEVQQAGRQMSFKLTSRLAGLTAQYDRYRLDQAELSCALRGTLAQFNQLDLAELTASLSREGQLVAAVNSRGQLNAEARTVDLQTGLDAVLPKLMALAPMPEIALSSGRLSANTRLVGKYSVPGPPTELALSGNLQLKDLTGSYRSNRLDRFEMTSDFALDVTNQLASIRRFTGTLKQAGQAGGSFACSGHYDLNQQAGPFRLTLADVNQHTLRSFVSAALGDRSLESASIGAHLSGRYDANGESHVEGDLSVTNLIVVDAARSMPRVPLAVVMQCDVSMQKQVVDLRRVQMSLPPTARATNQLNLAGKVDLTRSNAITGGLKLTADALDLTPYYAVFSSPAAAGSNAPASSQTATSTSPPQPDTGLPTVVLPFQNFVVDAAINRLFVQQTEITNFAVSARIDGGKVTVKPLQLALMGAPVNGSIDLDLSVPGYRYDLSLTAERVPIEPLANSFSPEYAGKAKGDIFFGTSLKGSGTALPAMAKSLSGVLSYSVTNADIRLPNPEFKVLFVKLNLGTIAKALGILEVVDSPLKATSARVRLGDSKMAIEHADVTLAGLRTDLAGVITLSDVFTNSALDLPVGVSVSRAWIQKMEQGLGPRGKLLTAALAGNTPPDAAMVKLPPFVRVSGTIGKHETKPDLNSLFKGIAVNVSQTLVPQLLNNFLGQPAGTNAPASSGSGTNASRSGLLDAIRGPARAQGGTNAPPVTLPPPSVPGASNAPPKTSTATNAPPTNKPARFNPWDLLKSPSK